MKRFWRLMCLASPWGGWLAAAMIAASPAQAIVPPSVVYRVDERALHELTGVGGMHPWPGQQDVDLIHHFDGESLEDQSSAFVSTSSDLRAVVEHAASLARPNSEEPFDNDFQTYIYVIRPGADFYDVEGSIRAARNAAGAGTPLWDGYSAILRDYGGMEEWAALNGIGVSRIIRYAPLTGAMLRRFHASGQLFSETFWASRWVSNTAYDPRHDADRGNSQPYGVVGAPRGFTLTVQNGTGPALPASLTCLGAEQFSRQRRRRSVSTCDAFYRPRLSPRFYSQGLFVALLH